MSPTAQATERAATSQGAVRSGRRSWSAPRSDLRSRVRAVIRRAPMFVAVTAVIVGMLPSTAGATSSPAPSPTTTTGARFTAPGGQTVGQGANRATIYWDAQGIPHIYASTLSGMWFGDGWVQAHDRMFQLELTRAAVEGDLSSLFGSSQLSTDQSQRLFFYTSAEYQAQYNALPASDKAALVAYSSGINAYETAAYATTASQQQLVPEEFWALGSFYGSPGPYRPAPWKPTDTLAIGVYLARSFGQGGGSELKNLAFLQYLQAQFAAKGDPNAAADAMAVFNDSRWINDPTAPTTVPASCPNGPVLTRPSQSRPGVCSPTQTASLTSAVAARPGSVRTPAVLDSTTSSSAPKPTSSSSPLVRQEVSSTATLRSLPEHAVLQAANTLALDKSLLLQRGPTMKVLSHGGSNAFAVAPWRSADHHALLWGAPQEGFSTPSVNYEVYLHAPQYDASGMAIAGEPFVLIGHNANISWTTTSEETMNQGVFVEQVRYTGSPPVPSTYYFNGQWIPVQVVNESIPVLGS
ncbi:MAG: penicillin acylase family protein, partial [Acidimicrobiales bacterium]